MNNIQVVHLKETIPTSFLQVTLKQSNRKMLQKLGTNLLKNTHAETRIQLAQVLLKEATT